MSIDTRRTCQPYAGKTISQALGTQTDIPGQVKLLCERPPPPPPPPGPRRAPNYKPKECAGIIHHFTKSHQSNDITNHLSHRLLTGRTLDTEKGNEVWVLEVHLLHRKEQVGLEAAGQLTAVHERGDVLGIDIIFVSYPSYNALSTPP